MKRHLAVLRRPIFFVVVNFFLVNTLFSLLPFSLGNIVYNIRKDLDHFLRRLAFAEEVQRSVAVGFGRSRGLCGPPADSGGIFLINYLLKPQGLGLTAVGGVFVSFIAFAPLAMLIGALGGLIAQSRSAEKTYNLKKQVRPPSARQQVVPLHLGPELFPGDTEHIGSPGLVPFGFVQRLDD